MVSSKLGNVICRLHTLSSSEEQGTNPDGAVVKWGVNLGVYRVLIFIFCRPDQQYAVSYSSIKDSYCIHSKSLASSQRSTYMKRSPEANSIIIEASCYS